VLQNTVKKNYRFLFRIGGKLIKIFLIVSYSLIFNNQISAQRLASTQDGDIVILFEDGSWKYAPTYDIDNSRNHGCSYEINQLDTKNGKKVAILKKTTFINHNYENQKINPINDFLHCDLAIGQIEGNKIVFLDYILQTKYGLYDHGIIQEGKKLLIKLKDHSTVELTLYRTDKGEVDKINNETKYHTFAYITPKNEKALKNSEACMILMPWSMGNEIYSIDYPRIFIEQLTCFD
jgi:hypothetical protein